MNAPRSCSNLSAMRALRLGLFFAVLLFPLEAAAQAWDPFPALGPTRAVALGQGVNPAPFATLDDCLERLGASTHAKFFAVAVNVTDAHGRKDAAGNDAVPYVDALYGALRPSQRLDPDTHVLIALGLQNRAVA